MVQVLMSLLEWLSEILPLVKSTFTVLIELLVLAKEYLAGLTPTSV